MEQNRFGDSATNLCTKHEIWGEWVSAVWELLGLHQDLVPSGAGSPLNNVFFWFKQNLWKNCLRGSVCSLWWSGRPRYRLRAPQEFAAVPAACLRGDGGGWAQPGDVGSQSPRSFCPNISCASHVMPCELPELAEEEIRLRGMSLLRTNLCQQHEMKILLNITW